MAEFTGPRPLLPLSTGSEGSRSPGAARDPLLAVGQRMEIRMIERLADGNVRLQLPAGGSAGAERAERTAVMVARLAGAISEALAARSEAGQRLMAEITRTSPSLEVRLLPSPGSAPGAGSAGASSATDGDRLSALLRQTLPAARALGPVLQALSSATPPENTANTARAETAASRIDALLRALPEAAQLTRPDGLQQATRGSGLWLESMLAQTAVAGSGGAAPNLSGDLKARLLRAADALRQMAAVNIQPGGPPTGGPASAGGLLEAMLGRLASLQLQSAGDAGDLQRWFFELPFRTPQGVQSLHGEIEQGPGSGAHEEAGDWRCRLTLDLPALGPTRIVLHSRSDQLHLHFTAERAETVERLKGHQSELRENLAARDLEPASVAVRQGSVDPDPHARPEHAHGMLDERA